MQLYETPENRIPSGAEIYAVQTKDHKGLRAMTAPASASAQPKGTVLFLNGRADFLERYFETMGNMQARGYNVAGMDWRGQGGSQRLLKDPQRSHIRSFREYDEDLRSVMEGVVMKNLTGPYYAIAHSTGGHILLRALVRQTWFKKAIVTSPLMELHYGKWPKGLAFFLAMMATAFGFGGAYLPGFNRPHFLLNGFDGNPLTSDAKRWARDLHMMREHPELGVGGPTYNWLLATMTSLKDLHLRHKGQGLNCPTMIVLAGRERVVDNLATHRYVQTMPGISTVTIQQSLHEILMENDLIRGEFLAAFDSFMA
jgi:lysophospholipase